ncbi:MAG: CBASS oligonucleotide cyclase [Terriglobales bacterium]
MGGGGGSSYTGWTSERLTEVVREEAAKATGQFEVEVAGLLSDLLAGYGRDAELVRERLDEAKEALEEETEASFDTMFGGSVAKHTYVDGLSDVDTLLIINSSKFKDQSPPKILERVQRILRKGLPEDVLVDHGKMAVSITYPDKMVIQLLPVLRTKAGLRVPSVRRRGWSDIDPDGFRRALTKVNDQCGGKLVPTIKLAKAVIANMPDKYRLTGYHVESIAIAAFKGHSGKKTTETMLPVFFERARSLVLAPIRDSTKQSVHVDDYLGDENSSQRQSVSHLLWRIAKRMRNASAGRSKAQWKAVFDHG